MSIVKSDKHHCAIELETEHDLNFNYDIVLRNLLNPNK